MIVAPFHSKHPATKRYHTSNKCGSGSEIPKKNKVFGTGGFLHCHKYVILNRGDR
jgi:hypothetical protein